jgi:iron donor protein CyaY
MDDQQFKKQADLTLESLYRKLATASDKYEFEPDFNAGALSIEFEEPPAKFVISPNSPVHQIWVSANSKSYKLAWDAERAAFILPETGQNLDSFIQEAISTFMGETIVL